MTDEWRSLPIPTKPANDERRQVSTGAESDTKPGDWYHDPAKAEQDALRMMEHGEGDYARRSPMTIPPPSALMWAAVAAFALVAVGFCTAT